MIEGIEFIEAEMKNEQRNLYSYCNQHVYLTAKATSTSKATFVVAVPQAAKCYRSTMSYSELIKQIPQPNIYKNIILVLVLLNQTTDQIISGQHGKFRILFSVSGERRQIGLSLKQYTKVQGKAVSYLKTMQAAYMNILMERKKQMAKREKLIKLNERQRYERILYHQWTKEKQAMITNLRKLIKAGEKDERIMKKIRKGTSFEPVVPVKQEFIQDQTSKMEEKSASILMKAEQSTESKEGLDQSQSQSKTEKVKQYGQPSMAFPKRQMKQTLPKQDIIFKKKPAQFVKSGFNPDNVPVFDLEEIGMNIDSDDQYANCKDYEMRKRLNFYQGVEKYEKEQKLLEEENRLRKENEARQLKEELERRQREKEVIKQKQAEEKEEQEKKRFAEDRKAKQSKAKAEENPNEISY